MINVRYGKGYKINSSSWMEIFRPWLVWKEDQLDQISLLLPRTSLLSCRYLLLSLLQLRSIISSSFSKVYKNVAFKSPEMYQVPACRRLFVGFVRITRTFPWKRKRQMPSGCDCVNIHVPMYAIHCILMILMIKESKYTNSV